jgi:hypothetical protein
MSEKVGSLAPQVPLADRNVTLAADGSGKFG